MIKKRTISGLIIAILFSVWLAPVQAMITEREAREFVGYYVLVVKSKVTENGVTRYRTDVIRDRISWNQKPGNGEVALPGGSFRPLYTRVVGRPNFIRIKTIFVGSVIDEEENFHEVNGNSVLILKKGGRGRINAFGSSRLAVGNISLLETTAKGRKIR